jgi:putative endopeptidase
MVGDRVTDRRSLALVLPLVLAACRTSAPAPTAPPAPAENPGVDPSLIDATVKPCDDFYRYACGGWLARTPIPPDEPSWGRISELRERNLRLLRDIAQAQAAGRIDPEDRFARKVGDYYAACMDEPSIEARGTAGLHEMWRRLDAVRDLRSLAQEVGLLHREGISPVFVLESGQDAKDATQVIGIVEQGGLSLPDRDYYLKEDPRSVEIQRSFRAHVATMLALAGEPAERARADAEAIYALERRMAEAHWTRVEMRDPVRTYNRVELSGLERAAPRFAWKVYLEALNHGGLTTFSTTTPRFLARVNELLGSTPIGVWRTYLRWRVLSTLAAERALPKAFVEERFRFVSRHFTGQKELEARWKFCARSTDRALGEALGQAYVRRYFGAEAKERMRHLVSATEGAMGRDLDALPWMDAPTRAEAQAKLSSVDNKVGYPDSWRDYGSMQVDRGSFLRSVLAARAFEVNRDLDKIGKPVDRNEWEMSPPAVNAYYDPSLNEMVFPAGILQPPFFTQGAPDAANYGAIGVVVGHELTHGFDDEGRKFNASGNLDDWWTPSVGREFERRAACLVDQFQGYQAEGEANVDGHLTLGENIADLGGLRLALAAWRASGAGKQGGPPIAGFTPDQAFFLAFAQSWCTSVRPETARLRARIDPHSPPRWRVDGPLSDLPEFQHAFSCPAGSPMVRANRCEVW